MADTVDVHIGNSVRALRTAAGLTTADAASALGLDLAGYRARETGAKRLRARELFALARLLEAPVSAFFAHCPHRSPGAASG